MIRLILAGFFLAAAVFVYFTEVFAFYRYKYVMNRMHAAALGDTLGIACVLIAAAIIWGSLAVALKLFLVLLFLNLTAPVLTHLLAEAEVRTHRHTDEEYVEVDRR